MKGVLAGVHLHNFLSVKAFIGKWIGIVLSIAAGLSMGRQIAYIHFACCIAHQLYTRVEYFKEIALDYQTRISMLAAAISSGACVAWSTPIGGVVLAMKLSATHFFVGNIMKCLLASTIGLVSLHWMNIYFGAIKDTKHSDFESIGLNH